MRGWENKQELGAKGGIGVGGEFVCVRCVEIGLGVRDGAVRGRRGDVGMRT